MTYLLDTHIFIWWMRGDKRLSKKLETLIKDPENEVCLSVVNVWEVVVKKRTGKLSVPRNWKSSIRRLGFRILSVHPEHIYPLESLPLYHKDPFDRILIAQAKAENLTLITSDKKIWKYRVNLLKV